MRFQSSSSLEGTYTGGTDTMPMMRSSVMQFVVSDEVFLVSSKCAEFALHVVLSSLKIIQYSQQQVKETTP